MSNIKFLHGYTKDGLNLQGVHWDIPNKKTCVVFIHGMAGNIIDSYFAEVLGNELSKHGHGFLYGHNRGHSHISDFLTKDGDYIRIGASYEIFEESFYDIDLWVKKAIKLGYKSIILIGHSIGSNKAIYYLSKSVNNYIKKIVLISPSDMVGDTMITENNYDDLVKEAKKNIKTEVPDKLLNELLDDWYLVSSKTFLDSCVEGMAADNMPLLRKPDKFDQLSKINIPMLVIYGDKENSEEFNVRNRLNIIKEKAVNCPKCDTAIVPKANHDYQAQEKELANIILDYLNGGKE